MENISINKIIEDLNKVGYVIKVQLAQRDISFKQQDWAVYPSATSNEWIYKCINKKIESFDLWVNLRPEHLEYLNVEFYKGHYNDLYLKIFIQASYFDILFQDIKKKVEFASNLAKTFLKNNLSLTMVQLKQLENQHANTSKQDRELANALTSWGNGNNYEKAVEFGKQLEKLEPCMPAETKQSSTNKLFRLIVVAQSLLDKVLHEDKPLILEDRRYSSWTTSARASSNFAKNRLLDENQAYVILQKTFTPSEIMVNVLRLAQYLNRKGEIRVYEYMHDEQEIIVKNIHNDYKFTLKNIGLWKNKQTRWAKPHVK